MPLRIHIAEDEPRSARLLMQLVERYYGEALVFEVSKTVAEVQNRLKINTPNLLFLDMELSGKSGFEVLDAFPKRTFPVVITSARKEWAFASYRYGVVDYLLKPLHPTELFEALERCERFFPLAQ